MSYDDSQFLSFAVVYKKFLHFSGSNKLFLFPEVSGEGESTKREKKKRPYPVIFLESFNKSNTEENDKNCDVRKFNAFHMLILAPPMLTPTQAKNLLIREILGFPYVEG